MWTSPSTCGRLSDVERNAFWASIVSMMPAWGLFFDPSVDCSLGSWGSTPHPVCGGSLPPHGDRQGVHQHLPRTFPHPLPHTKLLTKIHRAATASQLSAALATSALATAAAAVAVIATAIAATAIAATVAGAIAAAAIAAAIAAATIGVWKLQSTRKLQSTVRRGERPASSAGLAGWGAEATLGPTGASVSLSLSGRGRPHARMPVWSELR